MGSKSVTTSSTPAPRLALGVVIHTTTSVTQPSAPTAPCKGKSVAIGVGLYNKPPPMTCVPESSAPTAP